MCGCSVKIQQRKGNDVIQEGMVSRIISAQHAGYMPNFAKPFLLNLSQFTNGKCNKTTVIKQITTKRS